MMELNTRLFLYNLAKKGHTIGYKELCMACYEYLDFNKRNDRREFYNRLTIISEFESTENRPLLSVLVVKEEYENGIRMPGDGYFKMAFQLKKYNGSETFEDKKTFFEAEFKRTHDYWINKKITVRILT